MSVNYERQSYETVDQWIARMRAEQRAENGAADPNDAADKLLFSAKREVLARSQEVIPGTNQKKPPDQLLVEAIQAELRRNPELAAAWKEAPGKMSSN